MGTMMKTTVSTTANVRARGTVSGARGYGLDVFLLARSRLAFARLRTSASASASAGDDARVRRMAAVRRGDDGGGDARRREGGDG